MKTFIAQIDWRSAACASRDCSPNVICRASPPVYDEYADHTLDDYRIEFKKERVIGQRHLGVRLAW